MKKNLVLVVLAGWAFSACGGDDKKSDAAVGSPPSATTLAATPTETSEQPPTSPTPAEPIEPISDLDEIKTGLSDVYRDKSIPHGSCPVEAIHAFADQSFLLYSKNPNKFTLAGQIATIYAEVSVFAEAEESVSAEVFAKSLRAGVEILIEQHLQERGLPAANKAEVVAAWEQNVARKVRVIEDGSGCNIVIEVVKQ